MRKIISLLLVMALIVAVIPAALAAEQSIVLVDVSEQMVTPNAPYVYEGVAESSGTLTVTPSGSPDWGFKVSLGNVEGVMQSGSFAAFNWDVEAGQAYKVEVYAYTNWSQVDGTVGLKLTFTPGDGSVEKKLDYIFDDASSSSPLKVGTHELTLDESAYHTLYTFSPDEIGVYTFTVNEGATIGYWGAGSFYVKNPNSTAVSIEKEIKSVGNSAVVGITSENPNVTLTIEKTGESAGIVETVYINWENVHTPSNDLAGIPEGVALTDIDITKAYTVVLGQDGFYHLDSATGPIIYVDLKNGDFDLGLAFGGYGALTMRGEFEGVNYDFKPAMSAYNAAITGSDGVYPVTEDLYAFLHGYGYGAGCWYSEKLSCFDEIIAGNFHPDSAWLVMCSYAPVAEPVEEFLVLTPGENAARMVPGVNYILRLSLGTLKVADSVLTWSDDVVVTADGVVVTSPYSLSGYTRATVLVATVAEETNASFGLEEIREEGIADGLHKAEDGNYYYYLDGAIATEFTGLANNFVGTWYILNGQVQTAYDGLITYDGTKYDIKAGMVSGYDGLKKLEGTWLYFGGGVNDIAYEGLIVKNGMECYVENGEINFNKTDVVNDNGTLKYVKYGIVCDTDGLVKGSDGVWRYVESGVYTGTYKGLAKNAAGWWYVENSLVDTTFTGLGENHVGRWYVKWGQPQVSYTGTVTLDGITYNIKNGLVVE